MATKEQERVDSFARGRSVREWKRGVEERAKRIESD